MPTLESVFHRPPRSARDSSVLISSGTRCRFESPLTPQTQPIPRTTGAGTTRSSRPPRPQVCRSSSRFGERPSGPPTRVFQKRQTLGRSRLAPPGGVRRVPLTTAHSQPLRRPGTPHAEFTTGRRGTSRTSLAFCGRNSRRSAPPGQTFPPRSIRISQRRSTPPSKPLTRTPSSPDSSPRRPETNVHRAVPPASTVARRRSPS